MTQEPALQGRVKGGEADNVESEGGVDGGGAASSSDRAAGEDELRRDAGELGGPVGLLIAGEQGHVGEVLAEGGVPAVELGKKLVTDAVAGEGGVEVGGVFTPGLVEGVEIAFDLGAGHGEQGTEDAALGKMNDGMDAGEALGPCAAEELGEDGFRLVVESVGGGDGVDFPALEKPAKPGVAQAAGGFFDGFFMQLGFGGGVDLGDMEDETEGLGEIGGEALIGVRFGAAQAVMEMGGVEDEAELAGAGGEGEGEGYGIAAAGEGDGEAKAGG